MLSIHESQYVCDEEKILVNIKTMYGTNKHATMSILFCELQIQTTRLMALIGCYLLASQTFEV